MARNGKVTEYSLKFSSKCSAHQKLKILQFSVKHSKSICGIEYQIQQGLPIETHRVTNAFLRGSEVEKPNPSDNQIKFFNFKPYQLNGLKRWISIWSVYRYFKKQDFDLIIAHRFKPIHIALYISKWLKIPMVGVAHGFGDYDRKYRRRILQKNISPITTFVGVSEPVKDYLISMKCGFTEQNTVYVNNSIDITETRKSQLSRAKAREALGLPLDNLIIGSVGRIVPVKGYIYLLKAFEKIHLDCPNANLLIIGNGAQKPQLDEYVISKNLSERVFLVGWKEDAYKYVQAFDIFVMTSLSEGRPIALLEAMSGRIPIVGTDILALKHILIQSGGRVFPPKDTKRLSEIMKRYLEMSPIKRKQLGEQAYQFLLNQNSLEDFHRSYRRIIENSVNPK